MPRECARAQREGNCLDQPARPRVQTARRAVTRARAVARARAVEPGSYDPGLVRELDGIGVPPPARGWSRSRSACGPPATSSVAPSAATAASPPPTCTWPARSSRSTSSWAWARTAGSRRPGVGPIRVKILPVRPEDRVGYGCSTIDGEVPPRPRSSASTSPGSGNQRSSSKSWVIGRSASSSAAYSAWVAAMIRRASSR